MDQNAAPYICFRNFLKLQSSNTSVDHVQQEKTRYINIFLHIFFFLECINYLLQKNWQTSKFGNPILIFRSMCLEKITETIFFRSHVTIPFYLSFWVQQSLEKLEKVRIWQVNFRCRKWSLIQKQRERERRKLFQIFTQLFITGGYYWS